MTLDPYPDLPGAEPASAADGGPGERPELSDADSRLLDVLSRHQPPVVTAVEDQPRTVRAGEDDVAQLQPAGRRGALSPVFQEPAD